MTLIPALILSLALLGGQSEQPCTGSAGAEQPDIPITVTKSIAVNDQPFVNFPAYWHTASYTLHPFDVLFVQYDFTAVDPVTLTIVPTWPNSYEPAEVIEVSLDANETYTLTSDLIVIRSYMIYEVYGVGTGNYVYLQVEWTACTSDADCTTAPGGHGLLARNPDLNGDNSVDTTDLLQLLGEWGPGEIWGGLPSSDEDLNCDGVVDIADLLILLENWSE